MSSNPWCGPPTVPNIILPRALAQPPIASMRVAVVPALIILIDLRKFLLATSLITFIAPFLSKSVSLLLFIKVAQLPRLAPATIIPTVRASLSSSPIIPLVA